MNRETPWGTYPKDGRCRCGSTALRLVEETDTSYCYVCTVCSYRMERKKPLQTERRDEPNVLNG